MGSRNKRSQTGGKEVGAMKKFGFSLGAGVVEEGGNAVLLNMRYALI